jgi:tripartite-type tricarboxylate transporter receptor subunit TctC
MRQYEKRSVFLAIGLLTIAGFRAPGFAAEKAPFYQGKTLNIVINFAAGGPTDIESRIFADHHGAKYGWRRRPHRSQLYR